MEKKSTSEGKFLKEAKFQKKSPSLLGKWQTRTFRLYPLGFSYSDPKEWKPKDQQNVSIHEISDVRQSGICLQIIVGKSGSKQTRTYDLKADNEQVAAEWAQAIDNAKIDAAPLEHKEKEGFKRLKEKIKNVHQEPDGFISLGDMYKTLQSTPLNQDFSDSKFLSLVKASAVCKVKYSQFIDEIISSSAGEDCSVNHMSTEHVKQAADDRIWEKPKISCWNIKSPELSENIFEMYPGWAMLPKPEQMQLLTEFQDVCQELVLSKASPKLGDILKDDIIPKEFEKSRSVNGPEACPIDPGKDQEEGLKKFFEVRLQGKSSQEVDSFVSTWLQDPMFRWKYWKDQSLYDFCAEDGSGGKTNDNEFFKGRAQSPILDDVAWNLTLGVADFRYRYKGLRSGRTDWLLLKPSPCDVAQGPQPKDGKVKYDFFKLMVWDLALLALRDEARKRWKNGTEAWDQIFEDIKKTLGTGLSPESNLNAVVENIASYRSDILVLTEMNKAAIGQEDDVNNLVERIKAAGGFRYRILHAKDLDQISNTVVLARKERFDRAEVTSLLEKDGNPSFKKIVVNLHSVDGQDYQVVAAHLSGGKHDLHPFFDQLEKQLNQKKKNTIVMGDFNFDFRQKKMRDKVETDEQGNKRKLLCELLEDSKSLWDIETDLGSVSKKRTALQCQVSKIDMADFSCKDFILLSEDLQPEDGQLTGLIARAHLLPDADCPSDHAAVHWETAMQILDEQNANSKVLGRQGSVKEDLSLEDCLEKVLEVDNKSKNRTSGDLIKRLSSDLNLPSAEQSLVASFIEDRESTVRCNQEYENCMEIHQDLVNSILKAVSEGKTCMDQNAFASLHSAVWSILHIKMEEIMESEKESPTKNYQDTIISNDPKVVFEKIDLDKNRSISAAETLMWMRKIAILHPPWRNHIQTCLEDIEIRCCARIEIEKYKMARELTATMAQYGQAYTEVKKKGIFIESVKPEGGKPPMQPDSIKSIEDLKEQGEEIFEEVREFGEQLRTTIKSPFWSMGPLKQLQRAKEKIAADYGGDPKRLIDMVRLSVLCDDMQMAKEAIDFVRKHEDWKILRIKSTLNENAKVGGSGGYRDVKINAEHASSGHVVEIQLHILIFYCLKQETGHKIYEWSRRFAVAGVTSAEDVMSELSPKLLKEMFESAELDLTSYLNQKEDRSTGRKAIEKRMTVFDILRLSRANKESLKEHGRKLLDMVDKKQVQDPRLEKDILLMVGKAYDCSLPEGTTHKGLLERACKYVVDIPENDRSTADKLFLAVCNMALGNATWNQSEEALKHFKDALALLNDCGWGEEHPQVAKTKKNLGALLINVGKAEEGLEMLMSAEAAFTELFGARDHRTSQVLLELGIGLGNHSLKEGVQKPEEMWLKSIWYMSRCLNSRRLCFGDHDERVGNVYWEMAVLKQQKKDTYWTTQAIQDFNSCVSIWTKSGTLEKQKKKKGQKFKDLENASKDQNKRKSMIQHK